MFCFNFIKKIIGNFRFLVEWRVMRDILFLDFFRLLRLEVRDVEVKKFIRLGFLFFVLNCCIVLFNFFRLVR